MRFWLHVALMAALVALAVAAWGGELYRCGNTYTDKPGPGCRRVEDRVSTVPSPHKQHRAELEARVAGRPEPAQEPAQELPEPTPWWADQPEPPSHRWSAGRR